MVTPGRTRYELGDRGAVTVAAQPDATLLVILVEAARDADWRLGLVGVEAPPEGEEATDVATLWTPEPLVTPDDPAPDDAGHLGLRMEVGQRAAFLLGDAAAADAVGDPFAAADAWVEQTARRGLRLRTPYADLDRAVEFAKAHLLLGYDWNPDADGRPGGEGSKMVCDIFRWRDVWSRDFGSGFGPGGVAAGLTDAVLATLGTLPIATWTYDAEPGVRHLGPTSQDFAAAFGLGGTDEAIATVDADGVALAALQALLARVEALEARVAAQDAEIERLRAGGE